MRRGMCVRRCCFFFFRSTPRASPYQRPIACYLFTFFRSLRIAARDGDGRKFAVAAETHPKETAPRRSRTVGILYGSCTTNFTGPGRRGIRKTRLYKRGNGRTAAIGVPEKIFFGERPPRQNQRHVREGTGEAAATATSARYAHAVVAYIRTTRV